MSRPEWQQQPCPEWCTVIHADGDHPDDRSHRDDGVVVPVISRRRHYEGDALVERVEAVQIVLGRWQRDGEEQSWRFLGIDGGGELELSEASFVRLADTMRRLVA